MDRSSNFHINDFVGGKLSLEEITKEDKGHINEITSSKNIMENLGSGNVLNDEELNKFLKDIQNKKQIFFKLMDGNKFIGIIGVNEFLKLPSLTIAFKKEAQGKGYLKKALKLFHDYYKKKFYIIVKEKNKKMLRIARKNFKYVGRRLLYGIRYLYIFEYN